MASREWFVQRLIDLKISAMFLTRLPVPHSEPVASGALSRALWTAPLIGAAVGTLGAVVYAVAHAAHLPPVLAATLAIAATAVVTGCLHEDGLADVADGFGGGATRERKLEIMRDSRIGTYGVFALLLSVLLRIGALTSLADPVSVATALLCAHAAARAGLPALMKLVPAARTDGMSAHAGTPPDESVIAAALLGVGAMVAGLGIAATLAAQALLAAALWFVARLSKHQIGGQTGDVLGAFEQAGEIIVLLVAVAASSWSAPAQQIRVHDPAVPAARLASYPLDLLREVPQPSRHHNFIGRADIGPPVDLHIVLD